MAPSSKSEKNDSKHKPQRRHKDHIVKLLVRGKITGQLSQHLFRNLPPRVCVPLKNIVSEEFLRAGHIFLGFTKCGRYVLSYTRDWGEDDDFSFYTYYLYWWEFNLHSRLKQVQYVRLFAGEEIYNDLYLTVCGWPNDQSKIVIFGFNSLLMAENYRDIYITIVSMPSPKPCPDCCKLPSTLSIRNGSGKCLEHGYVLNSRYQVVYPFPTFQHAFQLKKDQVILLNTSYSLVACGISLCQGKQGDSSQILYTKRAPLSYQPSSSSSTTSSAASSLPHGVEPSEPGYVNYSRLHYCHQQPCSVEQNTGAAAGYEDDKVQLPFTVTDLKGQTLQLVCEPHNGQSVCVEQLTLDFEYLINEVIRRDAAWAPQFCSFSDYDVVILEVCPETNIVMISIGLLLLALSASDHCRPNTYHSNLQVSWDLNTGVCCTVGVGGLTEVKGQTSGRVWSSYRKSCVNTLMKWLVPESGSRNINRMTNEGLHKGSSLQVLADSDRCTWIVL
ncbi:DDB1- and CUL4-associated factor 15 isoform X2 [Dunckerocampus dactyliophorus]|uniref:DDB1- and CUL4-associated factor 15 isoform X2 n=1 Tax=Dunckerocampus dactyliophorus TaxID=161453 RepID=UPI0024060893|nr:DDB1- and CUL4-associated factor 15 isoform X2 [Dunckerocampus dactyliophorus]